MRRNTIVAAALAAVCLMEAGNSLRAQVTLVQNGQPTSTIVVAKDPTKSAAFAAVELQAHVCKITGAMLPIATDDQPLTGTRILVGESAATAALGYSNLSFQAQEYLITNVQNSTLVLMGRDKEERITTNCATVYTNPGSPAPASIGNGRYGHALAFNGSNAVYAPNPGLTPAQGTIEAWIRINDNDAATSIIFGMNWNDGYMTLWRRPGSLVNIEFVNGEGCLGRVYSDVLTVGQWYHLVITYNAAASELELFVDGVSRGTAPYALPSGPDGVPLKIGGSWAADRQHVDSAFVGDVDEVRVSACVRDGWAAYTNQPPAPDEYTALLMHLDATSGVPLVEYLPYQLNLGNVLLPGLHDEQATCYAVYDFLERYGGVRWFNPTEYGTVCSNMSTLTVTGPNVRRSPFFKMRGNEYTWEPGTYDAGVETLWPYGTAGFDKYVAAAYPAAFADCGNQSEFDSIRVRDTQLFLRRMRAGGEQNFCNHSLYWWDRFKDSNPAYFAQGFETITNNDRQLCYSNPDVIQQLTTFARDYYDGTNSVDLCIAWNPKLPNEFPIEPMDSPFFCTCANCQAWMNVDPSWFGSTSNHNDYFFNFVNQVAAGLQTTHPGKRVISLAYATHAALPSRISLNTNVDVQYCFIYSQSPSTPLAYNRDMDWLRAWGRESRTSGRTMYFWLYPMWWMGATYYPPQYKCFPPYTAHAISNQFAIFSTNNYSGMFYCGWGPEVDAYVSFQLMNNPTQNVNGVLSEYFSRMYGPAAGPISNIYCMIENIVANPSNRPPEGLYAPPQAIDWGWRGTAERMASLSNLMAQAVSAVTPGTAYATNVNLFKIGTWDYMVSGRQDFVQTYLPPAVSLTTPANGVVTNAPVILTADTVWNVPLINNVSSRPLSTGWHHVLATHDVAAGKMELFLDGVLQKSMPYLRAGARNMDLRIGGSAWDNGVNNGYVGYLDEVRVSRIVRNGPATYQQQLTNPPAWDADTTVLLHFDNPSTELAAVGAEIHGPLNQITGRYGNALVFNDDTFFNVPNGAFGDEVGTWEAWVYLTDGGASQGFFLMTYGGQGLHQFHLNTGGGVGYWEVADGFNVKFYADGALIGTANSYPYTCLWTAPSIGQHTLTATATDLYNLTGTSTPVTITVTTNTLVSRWNFENNATDTAPSGTANNGTLKSGMTYNSTDKKVGSYALNFVDTSRQYMSAANQSDLNPTGKFTICAWVKPTNWTGNRRILQKGNDGAQYRLYHNNSTSKLVCEAKIGGTVKTVSIARPSSNAWHHVAAVYDGAALKLYVDGGTPASTASSGSVSTTTSTLYIGTKTSSSTTTGDYWKGVLDDVRIFKERALTQSEIQALMGVTQ